MLSWNAAGVPRPEVLPLVLREGTMRTTVRPPSRTLTSLVVAPLAALVGLLVLVGAGAPATAASGVRTADAQGSLCTGDTGVNVVVDFGALGGGVQQDCVADGDGQVATKVFTEAGHELTPVGAFPGAACKVDGEPASGGCAQMPPANAYWGLFLAQDAAWDYAPKGADELELSDGDFVAFAWQGTKKATPPSVEPVAATTAADSSGDASDGASPSPSTSPSSDATTSPGSGDGTGESAVESTENGRDWVVPFIGLLILGGAGGVLLVRRRRNAGE